MRRPAAIGECGFRQLCAKMEALQCDRIFPRRSLADGRFAAVSCEIRRVPRSQADCSVASLQGGARTQSGRSASASPPNAGRAENLATKRALAKFEGVADSRIWFRRRPSRVLHGEGRRGRPCPAAARMPSGIVFGSALAIGSSTASTRLLAQSASRSGPNSSLNDRVSAKRPNPRRSREPTWIRPPPRFKPSFRRWKTIGPTKDANPKRRARFARMRHFPVSR